MNPRWIVLAVVLVLSSLVMPGVVGAVDEPSNDSTVTTIAVNEDGSAKWTIEIRTALESDSDVENYRAYMNEFNSNSSEELGSFKSQMTTAVSTANSTTDRSMEAHSFSAEADIEGYTSQYGVVRFTFVWENFASVEDSSISVGDAFDGQYFIGENEYLRIQFPQGYTIDTVTPDPETQATSHGQDYVLWSGPYEFASGKPTIHTTAAANQPADDTDSGLAIIPIIGGLLIAGIGGYALYQRSKVGIDFLSRAESQAPSEGSLVTDEERVLNLLDAGERVKQTEIRDELEWSDSKTSRVLSNLEDEGLIEKLRLGRENVVRRADDDAE